MGLSSEGKLDSPSFLETALYGVLFLSAVVFAVAALIWWKAIPRRDRWD